LENNLKYIIDRIVNDDELALKDLFQQYSSKLLAYTFSITRSRQTSEEIVEDVFFALWKNRKMLKTISNILYYLYTACKNRAINYLQREKKNFPIDIDTISNHYKIAYSVPESDFISKENMQKIISAIKSLPPKCQLVFKLAKEDDLSHKEIADILHISLKAIEKQLNIALTRIAKSLSNSLPEYNTYYSRYTKK
jgi:RNA polymerase sigma-70 factor (ECF subfamily)